jgi:RNA polymerase sigma-70 factor (ECF subfamily)
MARIVAHLEIVRRLGVRAHAVIPHQLTVSEWLPLPKPLAATSQPSDGRWDCNFISRCRSVLAGTQGISQMTIVCLRGGGTTASPQWAAAGESSSDEALIRRIAAGDQSAMRALFARYRVALYRWLLRLVDDGTLAEDLLSEVFLDVWKQAASFEARSSVSTWLLAIARYKALSARRRRTDAELDEATISMVPDMTDDPEVALQKKDRAEALRQSLPRLSPEHREVIDLAYYHSKSVKQIAEIVGINEATVKTRMFYARKKLAELVASA